MYGQMTAGSWIYIGTPGHRPGHLRDLRRGRAPATSADDLAGRLVVTAGLGGMGGAQPLAATMNGATALVAEVDPERIEKRLQTRYLDERETRSRSRDRPGARRARTRGARSRSACVANAVDLLERLIARGIVPGSRHRPDLRPRRAERLRAARRAATRTSRCCAAEDPESYIERSYATMADARARASRAPAARRRRLRLRQQPARAGAEGRRGRRVRASGVSSRSTSGRSSARARGPFRWAALSGRSRGHPRRPTARSWSSSRTTSRSPAGCASPRSASRSRDFRRGSAGSAMASAHRAGLLFNRLVRDGKSPRADRHRPRPSGRRLRRLAQPRDRRHARRLRRDRRLADPERAAQHGVRRDVGLGPPRRRRRHRLFDPRRDGGRRRRHRRRRPAAATAS